jgi:hypothetical protein
MAAVKHVSVGAERAGKHGVDAGIAPPSAARDKRCASIAQPRSRHARLFGEVNQMRSALPRRATARRSAIVKALGVVTALGVVLACGGGDAGPSSSSGSSGSSGSGGTSGTSGSGGTSGSSGAVGPLAGPGTLLGGCRIFPADNAWNSTVDAAPLDADLMTSVMPGLALDRTMHPDWGAATDNYGIPINLGKAATPAPLTFTTSYGPLESDKLPCPSGGGEFCYPIPLTAAIEGGPGAAAASDRHVLFLATDGAPDHCVLYELYNAQNQSGAGFTVGGGAIWKLDSNALRPEGWTSADAAGLAILPGLVRWEEIQRGEITHAIRFTMQRTRQAYIHPATHAAGNVDAALPPMGLRVRLKATFDDSAFTGAAKIVAKAMKTYGLILADNGSDWYIGGESNDAWAPEMDTLLTQLRKVKGADFEIVKTGAVVIPPP